MKGDGKTGGEAGAGGGLLKLGRENTHEGQPARGGMSRLARPTGASAHELH